MEDHQLTDLEKLKGILTQLGKELRRHKVVRDRYSDRIYTLDLSLRRCQRIVLQLDVALRPTDLAALRRLHSTVTSISDTLEHLNPPEPARVEAPSPKQVTKKTRKKTSRKKVVHTQPAAALAETASVERAPVLTPSVPVQAPQATPEPEEVLTLPKKPARPKSGLPQVGFHQVANRYYTTAFAKGTPPPTSFEASLDMVYGKYWEQATVPNPFGVGKITPIPIGEDLKRGEGSAMRLYLRQGREALISVTQGSARPSTRVTTVLSKIDGRNGVELITQTTPTWF